MVSNLLRETGWRILESILSGTKSLMELYLLVDPRIKKPKEKFLKALDDFYTESRVQLLPICYEEYIHLDKRILKIL